MYLAVLYLAMLVSFALGVLLMVILGASWE